MLVLMLELLLVVIGRAGAGRLLLAMAMDRTDRSRTTAADGVAAGCGCGCDGRQNENKKYDDAMSHTPIVSEGTTDRSITLDLPVCQPSQGTPYLVGVSRDGPFRSCDL